MDGFLRMCWPNRSVLKMGFLTEYEDDSSPFFDTFDFAEGWCALENRSDVALGMTALSRLTNT